MSTEEAADANKSTDTGSKVVRLDSLPYIDPVMSDDYEQYALALVEDEMNQRAAPAQAPAETPMLMRPAVNCRTDLMKMAYEQARINSSSNNSNSNNNTRINDLQPVASSPTTTARTAVSAAPPKDKAWDATAWQEAVRRAKIAYEAERLRGVGLQVDHKSDLAAGVIGGASSSSSSMWKQYNAMLDQEKHWMDQALAAQRNRVEEINYERQREQQESGARQLLVLSTEYETSLQRLYQLKCAIYDLQQQQEIAE
jgi:Breast carcinoma amplified sequence 2 (BCAS2)